MSEKKDNLGYVLFVFIGILIAAGIYVFFHDPITAVDDNYQYSNGETIFNVTKVNDIETYITLYVGQNEQAYAIGLRNDPLSLEDIPVYGAVNTRIYGDSEVYITINPEANLSSKTTIAALEIDKIIDNELLYNIPVSSAMTMPNTLGYPIKSCSSGTDTTTIIWLTLGSETQVYTENYCIIIVGTNEDEIIRAADRFVYQLLGIMV
ncbi:hypothetical protein EXS74_03105 [Candidatus Woesearchaeota archaeon]|nr:hypothetical protein [Candidatus Woesearchaeota archaeon]